MFLDHAHFADETGASSTPDSTPDPNDDMWRPSSVPGAGSAEQMDMTKAMAKESTKPHVEQALLQRILKEILLASAQFDQRGFMLIAHQGSKG